MATLLDVKNLSKQFISSGGLLRPVRSMHAVNDVSFSVKTGRVVGVVGESGCGKSTLARLVLRLIEPRSGSVQFEGTDLLALKAKPLRALRARMQHGFSKTHTRPLIRDLLFAMLLPNPIKSKAQD